MHRPKWSVPHVHSPIHRNTPLPHLRTASGPQAHLTAGELVLPGLQYPIPLEPLQRPV